MSAKHTKTAEAMVIYKSGDFQLKLPKKIEEELREYQKQFMQEDTKKELILDYLEHCQANMVCSRQLYAEALGNDGNPAQWEIREINDIMNNCTRVVPAASVFLCAGSLPHIFQKHRDSHRRQNIPLV